MQTLVRPVPALKDNAAGGSATSPAPVQLSIAERFRLAYVERAQREAVRTLKVLPTPFLITPHVVLLSPSFLGEVFGLGSRQAAPYLIGPRDI